MKYPIPFRRKHTWFEANVDAFADGALWGRDLERFEAHLATCDACTATLEQTLQLKSLVAALPEPALTRSFAIDHAMLSGARPEGTPVSGGTWTGAVRSMQGLAAAGIALFAVLMVVDVGGGTTATSPAGDHDSAPGEAGLTGEEADRASDGAESLYGDDGNEDPTDDARDDDDDDSSGTAGGAQAPEPTPTPGVGAAGNDPPTPAPTATMAPDETEPIVQDDPGANNDEPVLPPSAGDLTDFGAGAETTSLAAEESEGGVSGLRIAQALALGAAFVGVVGYAVVRRRAYAR